MMKSSHTGKLGELETARLLRKKGYTILSANFHSRFGEIDVIAQNGEYICFVEVKSRAPGQMFSPSSAVTVSKQRKIVSTASVFLSQNPTKLTPRFDIAEVIVDNGKVTDINIIENAFN